MPVENGLDTWQRVDVAVDLSRRDGEPGISSRRVDIVTPSQKIEVV